MSDIRVGLIFEPETSDRAEEIRAFLTDNKIEVVEVETSSEAIDEYLKVELLLLVVEPKFIRAMTRKFGELVLGPRDRMQYPSKIAVYGPDGSFRGYRPVDEMYSDTNLEVVFLLGFSETYWLCLLLLEILSLETFSPYRREIPFADSCSSDLQDYIKSLVVEGGWNQATEVLSKLNSVIAAEAIKLDLSEETIAQIEEAISRPIDSETTRLILAVLQFAEAASEMLPAGLWRQAEEKRHEIQQYADLQKRVSEAINHADDLMQEGESDRALRLLGEIAYRQENLPDQLVRELEEKMREIEISIAREESLKSVARDARDLMNVGEFSAVLRLIEQVSPDLRDYPQLRHLSREVEEMFDIGRRLADLLSLQDEIENHLINGNLEAASAALQRYGSDFLSRKWPYHGLEEASDQFYRKSQDALRLIHHIRELRAREQWHELLYVIDRVEQLDVSPRMYEWIQQYSAQVKNEAEGRRMQEQLRELEAKLQALTREIDSFTRFTYRDIIAHPSEAYQIRLRELYEERQRTQAYIDFIKARLGSFGPSPLPAPEQPLSPPKDKVQFTLFSPSKIRKTVRYSLVVYAHRPEMLSQIQVDAKKFIPEMGEHPPKQRTLPEPIEIAPKAEITIVPECEGIEFEPKSLTKTWEGDFVRYNFDFKAPEGFKEAEAWIRISVQIKGFEIASLKTSCEIVAESAEAVPASVALPDNPLIEAKKLAGLNQAVATPYKNIFVSYSHKDQPLALKCAKLIEQMLGSKVFIDVNGLRTGHDWKLEIAKAIDEAEIFELLWSEHTAASEFCRYEWDYALKTKCPDTRCVGVIRPIYWQEPPAPRPPELDHLQFGFVDLSDLIGKENAE